MESQKGVTGHQEVMRFSSAVIRSIEGCVLGVDVCCKACPCKNGRGHFCGRPVYMKAFMGRFSLRGPYFCGKPVYLAGASL